MPVSGGNITIICRNLEIYQQFIRSLVAILQALLSLGYSEMCEDIRMLLLIF